MPKGGEMTKEETGCLSFEGMDYGVSLSTKIPKTVSSSPSVRSAWFFRKYTTFSRRVSPGRALSFRRKR
jgi:hypothetical protein